MRRSSVLNHDSRSPECAPRHHEWPFKTSRVRIQRPLDPHPRHPDSASKMLEFTLKGSWVHRLAGHDRDPGMPASVSRLPGYASTTSRIAILDLVDPCRCPADHLKSARR